MSDISTRIKASRLAAGLTVQAMADLCWLPKRTLEHWEAGDVTVPRYAERLVNLALDSRRE